MDRFSPVVRSLPQGLTFHLVSLFLETRRGDNILRERVAYECGAVVFTNQALFNVLKAYAIFNPDVGQSGTYSL